MTISFIDKNKRLDENDAVIKFDDGEKIELKNEKDGKKKVNNSKSSIDKKSANLDKKNKTKSSKFFKKKSKKSDIPNLKNNTNSASQTTGAVGGMMTGTDSLGYLPSQRDWYTYAYDIVMSILLLASASGFFFIFQQAVFGNFNNLQTWAYPIASFSFLVILLLIYAVTVHLKKLMISVILLSFLSSLYFALEFWHGVVIIIGVVIIFVSVRYMRKALLNSVTVDMGTLARLGIINITLAIIFMMCSQYYWMIYKQPLEPLTARLENVKISEKVLGKVFKMKNDDGEESNKITVDEFLLMTAKGNNSIDENGVIEKIDENNENVSQDDNIATNLLKKIGINAEVVDEKIDDLITDSSEKVDELIVATMRTNLSKQLNQDLQGDEYISDVFDKIMYDKIISLVSLKKQETDKISYLALTLTFFLFISALLINTFARLILVWLTQLTFLILRSIGIIKVLTVKRETEMIIAKSSM